MPDHHHSEYSTHAEINGFGSRVDGLKERVAVQESLTDRNREDIEKVTRLVSKNAETAQQFQLDTATRFGKIEVSMANSVGAIDKKVGNLKWWMLGGLAAVGSVLRLLGFIM